MRQLPFDPQKSLINAFVTPIGTFRVPDAEKLNRKLVKDIHARMKRDEGQVRSNMGGWHSADDLLQWGTPAVEDLREWLQSAVLRMVSVAGRGKKFNCRIELAAWANINGPGQFNANHNHPGCHWSGVYYVKAGNYDGDPLPKAGHLQFYDPRGSINMITHPGRGLFATTLRVEPKDGLLVLFPGWLFHSVNPFLSDVERISIAFNARILSYEEAGGEVQGAKEKGAIVARGKTATKKVARKSTAKPKRGKKQTKKAAGTKKRATASKS